MGEKEFLGCLLKCGTDACPLRVIVPLGRGRLGKTPGNLSVMRAFSSVRQDIAPAP